MAIAVDLIAFLLVLFVVVPVMFGAFVAVALLVVVGELARVAYVCYSRVVRGSDAAGTAGGL
jgi:hypothetical protein